MSFNRPEYLRRVLESLRDQVDCDLGQRRLVLWQDGAISGFSGRERARIADIGNCKAAFQEIFPEGTVMDSVVNLGVALNFDRAERFAFEELQTEAAIFLEDDLVLSPHYIATPDQLIATFAEDSRVGYVAAYGDHKNSLADQHLNQHKLILLYHNWGFALYRRQWLRMRERVLHYLGLLKDHDYTERDHAAIFELFASWGFAPPASSQDAAKTVICCMDDVTKLNTYVCNGAYIGDRGVHMNPDEFIRKGYDKTVIYPERVHHIESLEDKLYRALLIEQREWAGKPQAPKSQVQPIGQRLPEPVPRMIDAELSLFTHLLNCASYYLEYGAGGSTLTAIRSKVKQIVSIETDAAWLERLTKIEEIAAAVAARRLTFRHVDLGPVGEWGVPKGEGKIKNWPRYPLDPFLATDLNFDLVLVDGRFRIHCLPSDCLLYQSRGKNISPRLSLQTRI